jgi:hypothetical protein
VFNAFWPRFEHLHKNYSRSAARSLTTGAELRAQLFFRGTAWPPITRLTREKFYVPRLTSYPRWFWAAGQQATGRADGHLFVMVQAGPGAPWRTAMSLYDLASAGRMLHYLATTLTIDRQGYASIVPGSDTSLDITPAAMPVAYARYLDHADSSFERHWFQDGPNTTGYISLERGILRGAGQDGWRDTDHQATAGLPEYALRLASGGAIVIFATDDTAGWTARSSSALLTASTQAERKDIPPAQFLQRLGIASVTAGIRVSTVAVDRVLAFVQPRGIGYIYVLINNGSATSVRKSRGGAR